MCYAAVLDVARIVATGERTGVEGILLPPPSFLKEAFN